MNCTHLMFAMLIWACLTPESDAAELSPDGRSSAPAAANVGEAAPPGAAKRGPGVVGARMGDRDRVAGRKSIQTQARTGVDLKPRDSSAAVSLPRSADRLRALLNTQAHAHLAPRPRRSVGSTGRPTLAGSPRAVTPTGSIRGGPRVQGFGTVDNRAFSRATRSTAIDGAQLHRKL